MFGFFTNKFKKNEINDDRKLTESVYKQILNLFSIDLEKLPDIHCEFIERDDSDSTNSIKYFYKRKLDKKQLIIFDHLEIIHFKIIEEPEDELLRTINERTDSKNLIFSGKSYDNNDLKKLASIFYKILGEDDLGRGIFNENDFSQIENSSYWLGRLWGKNTKGNGIGVMLSGDYENPDIYSLTLFGVK